MPTFREDIKLGTKVPLIKTDDISDNAVSEEKLSKAFRRKVNEIGEMTKEEMEDIVKTSELAGVGASLKKAKRKKTKQILIGKAIRPTSVSRSDVENWYAFIDNPCLVVKNTEAHKDRQPEVHLYLRHVGADNYEEDSTQYNIYDGSDPKPYRVMMSRTCQYIMYKVDRYQRSGYIHEIYLSYKSAVLTLKGQSLTNEWQNGKRVCNKKIRKETIEADLESWLAGASHKMNDLEYRRITSRKKTKQIRTLAKSYKFVNDRCRREVSWLNKNTHSHKAILTSGLFKVRINGKNGCRSSWQTIYVRVVGDSSKKALRSVTIK